MHARPTLLAPLLLLLALGAGCSGPPAAPSPGPEDGAGPAAPAGGGTAFPAGDPSAAPAPSGEDAGGDPGTPVPESSTPAGYGVPEDGLPTWGERTVLVFTNAVRLAPLDYRARYGADGVPSMAGTLEAYPAVAPVAWEPGLHAAARAHSADMAATPCFQHDSCDGTDWAGRIRSHYTLSPLIGENIAAGRADPRATVNQWLCDESGGACCADGESCDGHRRNIMSPRYRAAGIGYAANASAPYRHYWTQDFGGAAPAPPPLVDGSHALFPAGHTTFLANVSAPQGAATSVTLVLEDVEHPMAVALGTAAQGTWEVALPRAGACRSYHFVATDTAGRRWRYPAAGRFRTTTEGGCTEEYAP